MSLQVRSSTIQHDIILVEISGRLTRWPESETDEPLINELRRHSENRLVFDLTGVEQIDSSGTQLIFDCFSTVQKSGGQLRLACASARIARLFHMTRLDTVLPFYPTVAQACEGFGVRASGFSSSEV